MVVGSGALLGRLFIDYDAPINCEPITFHAPFSNERKYVIIVQLLSMHATVTDAFASSMISRLSRRTMHRFPVATSKTSDLVSRYFLSVFTTKCREANCNLGAISAASLVS